MFVWVSFGEGRKGHVPVDHPCCSSALMTCRTWNKNEISPTSFVTRYSELDAFQLSLFHDPTAENPEKRCFCIDVTSDNLLDAVKQTVEEDTLILIKRREAELSSKIREASAEEQTLATKLTRYECESAPIHTRRKVVTD